MLPLPACLPLQRINRPWLEVEGDRLLAKAGRITPAPHSAPAEQGDSNHPLELRNVAVPTQAQLVR